ncbi:MAG: CHAT domain-containing protein [Chryseolinea sp.]
MYVKKNFLLALFLLSSLFLQAQSLKVSDLNQADNLLLDSKYKEAISWIDSELTKTKNAKIGVILENKKAEALIRLGELDAANKLLNDLEQRASTLKESAFLNALIKTNKGFLYLNQGRNDNALEALQQAQNGFDQTKNQNCLEAAQALSYLGQVYLTTGKLAKAEEQMLMSLSIRQKILPQKHELIAASYNDLGFAYSQIDNDKALTNYELALSMYEQLHGKDHPKIAIVNTNMGAIYRNLELYGDAVNNFDNALKIWEKIYPNAHPTKAFVLFNLGRTNQKMGDQKAALAYYEKALTMYRTVYGTKHPEIASVLNYIGNLNVSQRAYKDALLNYQEAINANTISFDNKDISKNPKASDFYNGNTLLYSLEFKAQALEAQYFGKTLKLSDLESALKTLQVADTLIDKLRQQSTSEADKLALGQIANDVYADGVRTAYEASVGSVKKKDFRLLAFYFAEKSKSSVLLEAIAESDAKSFAGIPNDLLEEEQKIKSGIALTAQKLAQKPTALEEKTLRQTAYQLNRDYDAFTKRLETKFPEYFNLKYNTSSPTVSEIQRKLDSKTAILSYFIDDKNNTIYIFKLSKRKYEIISHILPKEFDRYITGLRNGLYFNELKTYKLSATLLSKVLIPKISSSIKSLVILPTGRLSIVPFETLFTKTPKEEGYPSLPYVLNRFNTRYEFSARLILQKSNKTDITSMPSIFLCAPIIFPEKDHLNELPGSESEVKKIDSLFKSKQFRSSLFINTDASEMLIKSGSLKNFKLIHFATHGIVDEKNAELSRIFLQTTSNGEDGNLFAGEIYNLSLQADLVTLSACQTGLGKISKGEGVIGLSRALVYAGAKNIIVSFWSVADESTSELMQDFYTNMLNTSAHDYSENLRQAKIKLIKEAKYAAPYYWAPFILIGF